MENFVDENVKSKIHFGIKYAVMIMEKSVFIYIQKMRLGFFISIRGDNVLIHGSFHFVKV